MKTGAPMDPLGKLRTFVQDMTRLIETAEAAEERILTGGHAAMKALIAEDDWLPAAFAAPHPEYYQQYLLYCDPFERFSIVSFVWGPGQRTPVHDHTVWGVIGMLRGAEVCRTYARTDPAGALRPTGELRLAPGEVTAVSPTVGDIHAVENAFSDRPSISIHAYGANIGAVSRHVFDPETGAEKPFVSGYAGETLPNLWDRSAQVRAGLA